MPRKTTHRPSATRTERRRAELQRRRQAAMARSATARRLHRRRRRLQTLGVIVAVLAVGGVGLAIAETRPGSTPPSAALRAAVVDNAGAPLGMGTVLDAYHAVYKAESYDSGKTTLSTEDVSIQRPFNGRVTIREGTTPAGALQFEGRSTLGSYANYSASGPGQVSGDAPTVAFGDVRLGQSLGDLVAKGFFVLKERRHILGQDCQVYRTGTPVQSLKIVAPTATDYSDVCMNDAGLPLEEVTVVSGKVTQHLTATTLDTKPNFEPNTFTVDGNPVSFDQGGSVVTPVDLSTAPVPGYWQIDTPDGFQHAGRYQVQTADQTNTSSGTPVTGYADVYVRGDDIVAVSQGPMTGEPDVGSSASTGTAVDGGPLGSAMLMYSTIGPLVAAHPTADTFVHVASTLPPDTLTALAAGIHQA